MKNSPLNQIEPYSYTSVAMYFLLLFSVKFTSCQGQVNNTNRVVKVTKSTDTTDYQDPFFYIEGQLCQHLRKLYHDSRGNLWMGTNVYDIMRYSGDSLSFISETDGIVGGRVTEIMEDKNRDVWFGSFGGLTKFDGQSFTKYMESEDRFDNEVWSMLIDSKGIFWVGATDGLKQFNGSTFKAFQIPKGPVKDTTTSYGDNRINCIIEDKNGILWIGTDGYGICRFDPKAQKEGRNPFSHLTKQDGLPDNNIGDLLQDRYGNIWIATFFGGISRYDGSTFTNFTEATTVNGIETGALYEDKDSNIWFAAENNGVYRYDGHTFQNYSQKDGLNTNGILTIYEDRQGRFWLGGWGGLFRYYATEENSKNPVIVSVNRDGPWD